MARRFLFPAGAGMNRFRITGLDLSGAVPRRRGMNRHRSISKSYQASVPRRRGDEPDHDAGPWTGLRLPVPRRRGDEPDPVQGGRRPQSGLFPAGAGMNRYVTDALKPRH